jgi:uncharacterized delta-60 repeat protein
VRVSNRLFALFGASATAVTVLFLGSAAAAPGDLDPSFGTGGEVELALGSVAVAQDIALQPDGKIVLAGSGPRGVTLARFDSNGTIDSSFGSGGTVEGPFGTATAVVAQPDGKLLAAVSLGGAMTVMRYDASGSLDSAFGSGGTANGPPGSAEDLVLQPDGKVVIGGSGPDPDSPPQDNIVLARFNSDGTPDSAFGSNGVVRTLVGHSSNAWALSLQPDGRILAAGLSWDLSHPASAMTVARYLPDGHADMTFGTNGVVTTAATMATAIGVLPDGRIVVAGTDDLRLAVMRLLPNGDPDRSFGSNGLVQIGNGGLTGASDLALQPDGRIVVAGWNMSVFALVRFGTSGELDPTFGQNGVSRSSFGFWSDARALALQPDGKILAAGMNSHESETHFAIARYRVTSPSTIAATPVTVAYGTKVTLTGTAADPRGLVGVLGRDCFAYSTSRLGAAREDSAGAWTASVTPRARTSYRVEIDGERSWPVDVQVRPRVTIRRLSRGHVQVRVLYGHSLEGETIELQRFRGGSWRHVRFGALSKRGRVRDGVVSRVTFKTVQRRGSLRAVLEQPNEDACFATGISRPLPR